MEYLVDVDLYFGTFHPYDNSGSWVSLAIRSEDPRNDEMLHTDFFRQMSQHYYALDRPILISGRIASLKPLKIASSFITT